MDILDAINVRDAAEGHEHFAVELARFYPHSATVLVICSIIVVIVPYFFFL